MFVPVELSRVCDEVDRTREELPVRFVVASLPVPAVNEPVDIDRSLTGIVRAVVSTVPAALVGVVAEIVTLHAAPVPRGSIAVQADAAFALTVWFAPVSVVFAKLTLEVPMLSDPPSSVPLIVSAMAAVGRLSANTTTATASNFFKPIPPWELGPV